MIVNGQDFPYLGFITRKTQISTNLRFYPLIVCDDDELDSNLRFLCVCYMQTSEQACVCVFVKIPCAIASPVSPTSFSSFSSCTQEAAAIWAKAEAQLAATPDRRAHTHTQSKDVPFHSSTKHHPCTLKMQHFSHHPYSESTNETFSQISWISTVHV